MPPRKSDVRPSTPVAAEEASPSSAKGAQTHDKADKKDKDKEKDKDKGKTEDAVTIEVRSLLVPFLAFSFLPFICLCQRFLLLPIFHVHTLLL